MKTRPLRWWSDAALDAAAAVLAPAWQAWCADWDLPAPTLEARNACAGEAVVGGWHWHPVVNRGTAPAWLGVERPDGIEAIRELLFLDGSPPRCADDAAGATPIAREVAAIAWRDLIERVLQSLIGGGVAPAPGDAEATAVAAPCEADWRPWSGAVDVTCETGRPGAGPIRLHLGAAAAQALLGDRSTASTMPASARVPVAHRRAAIERQVVRLAAELDGVSLDLGALASLRLGDVLALRHRLDEPVHLRLHDDRSEPDGAYALCAGLLGTRRDRRAVELVRAATPDRLETAP